MPQMIPTESRRDQRRTVKMSFWRYGPGKPAWFGAISSGWGIKDHQQFCCRSIRCQYGKVGKVPNEPNILSQNIWFIPMLNQHSHICTVFSWITSSICRTSPAQRCESCYGLPYWFASYITLRKHQVCMIKSISGSTWPLGPSFWKSIFCRCFHPELLHTLINNSKVSGYSVCCESWHGVCQLSICVADCELHAWGLQFLFTIVQCSFCSS